MLVTQQQASELTKPGMWLGANGGEGLTVFAFPRSQWRWLRTSNLVERLSQEIKRRHAGGRAFPERGLPASLGHGRADGD